MTIEPKISKYIDSSIDRAIERERKIFNKDMETHTDKLMAENRHHMESLKEFFHNDVKMLAELIQDRPTRDEVREIAREEIKDELFQALIPINAKLDFLNEERKEMLEVLADIKA